ncbi:MAG: MATE family efflux transporter [Clostridiales bacterium]|nr:MATE family efflux transporter [Clostridiales bacterium]
MLKPSQKQQEHYSASEIYKSFIKVAWPATAESVLLGLVNFIDSVMVSSQGHVAVAAVGITNQPRFIFYAVFFALNVGVTAIVSRRKGENRREDANKCLAQALSLCLILGIFLVGAAYIFSEPLLRFAGAKEDTLPQAISYFRITMVGLYFTSISMIINAAQRGAGNTRISMTTNMTANIVNCIFNALLINGLFFFPKLGVTGAAIATLLGNITSCILSIRSVASIIPSNRERFLVLRMKSMFKFDSDNIKLICKISSSAAVEQVFMRLGFFVVSKMVAELSTIDFSTHTICMNITNLSFCFGDGLGVAASALVGQNLGKKRPDLSIVYGKSAQRIGFVLAMGLFVLFTAGGGMMMNLFMTEEAEAAQILEIGKKILVILAFISPAQISQVIFSGCVRGAGDTRYAAIVSLVTIAVERPLFTYLLCYVFNFGVIGAWIAMLIDQYLRLILMAARFSGGKWAKVKV